eukprot:CAMPEP_0196665248 /NCGR_PEP_ID=MMETSP1086-20130531/60104_1 /TAXON_ID=77921 /ORGANISM="Cyanoptyche  gloeocystis , Strain SAG4.97" /LENGTH=39 /DNA_ID= /DNA_START= /DNA_END= /DNA_ORIENTATION=
MAVQDTRADFPYEDPSGCLQDFFVENAVWPVFLAPFGSW